MTLLAPGAHIFAGNLVIVEADCIYMYCRCGGLKMTHPLALEHPAQQMQLKSLWPACVCGTNERTKEAVQRALESVDAAIARFPDVGYVRDAIRRIASREEMKP